MTLNRPHEYKQVLLKRFDTAELFLKRASKGTDGWKYWHDERILALTALCEFIVKESNG